MLAGRKAGKRRPANIVLAVSLSAPSASLQWSPSYFFVLWLVGFAIGRGENAGTHRFIAGSSFLTAVRANRPPPGGPFASGWLDLQDGLTRLREFGRPR